MPERSAESPVADLRAALEHAKRNVERRNDRAFAWGRDIDSVLAALRDPAPLASSPEPLRADGHTLTCQVLREASCYCRPRSAFKAETPDPAPLAPKGGHRTVGGAGWPISANVSTASATGMPEDGTVSTSAEPVAPVATVETNADPAPPATPSSLDAAWKAAEEALPQRDADGKYPPGGRFIVLTGPIASGVYWAHARLFDGNEALREERRGTEPKGFAPVGAGPAAALLALAARLRESQHGG